MNASKEITAVFAGPPEKVMREGIREALSLFTVPFHSEFDLMIASPGGYPKDINLYQSQKALRHASLAVRPGSPMILAGACSEGVGHELYESWMKDKTSLRQVQEAFQREEFRLGPHKAMLFASDVMNRDVYFVSGLPDKTLRNLLLTPASSIQEAIDDILKKRSSGHRLNTAILPYGNATVPMAVDSDR
jgi:nickel-dependent lactate racemase